MKKKLRIGILFGGRSGEHEVSLLSAASILKSIDRKRYDVVPVGIDKQGHWLSGADAQRLLGAPAESKPLLRPKRPPEPTLKPPPSLRWPRLSCAAANRSKSRRLLLSAVRQIRCSAPPAPIFAQPHSPLAASVDVVFPVLHGTFGEDGTIQGLFELADIAYVGSGVLGSSAAMDKDAMKRMFAAAGLPQTQYVALLRSAWRADAKRSTRLIEKSLQYPVFVKPANLGSSRRHPARCTIARRARCRPSTSPPASTVSWSSSRESAAPV